MALKSNRLGAATLLKLYLSLGLSYFIYKMGTTTICQSFLQDPLQHKAPGGVPQKAAMCYHHPSKVPAHPAF